MFTANLYVILKNTTSVLVRLANTAASIFRNRAALKQLSEMDDHMLADIGLSRSDVTFANAKPFYANPLDMAPQGPRKPVHSSEITILARWPRPLPERPYMVKPLKLSTSSGSDCCQA